MKDHIEISLTETRNKKPGKYEDVSIYIYIYIYIYIREDLRKTVCRTLFKKQ